MMVDEIEDDMEEGIGVFGKLEEGDRIFATVIYVVGYLNVESSNWEYGLTNLSDICITVYRSLHIHLGKPNPELVEICQVSVSSRDKDAILFLIMVTH